MNKIQLHLDHVYCDTLDKLKDEVEKWSRLNKDCTFLSHSVCNDGRCFLLTIVYNYKD